MGGGGGESDKEPRSKVVSSLDIGHFIISYNFCNMGLNLRGHFRFHQEA